MRRRVAGGRVGREPRPSLFRPLPTGTRGMVTVEVAAASLALSVVAVACLWLAAAAFQLGHCQVTANEVARQHARGDTAAAARAGADAPAGARVDVNRGGGLTVVVVSLEARVGPFSWPMSAEARVLDEVG